MIGPLKAAGRVAVVIALVAWAGPSLASCRPADAAARGGQAGFDRAQAAAQTLASNENSAQTALQKCISSITSRPSSNMFPSLGDVFGQIVQKVCAAVSQEVNKATSQVDLTSQIDSAISDINKQASSSTGGLVTNPVSMSSGSGASSNAGSSADFWSTVWK